MRDYYYYLRKEKEKSCSEQLKVNFFSLKDQNLSCDHKINDKALLSEQFSIYIITHN